MTMKVNQVVFCLLLAPLAQASEATVDSRGDEARTACMAGDFQKGVRLLAELYTASDDPIWIFNQARCYHQNAQPALALSRFQEFIRKSKGGPDDEDVRDAQKYIAEIQAEQQHPAATAAPVGAAGPGPVVTASAQTDAATPRPGSTCSRRERSARAPRPPTQPAAPPCTRSGGSGPESAPSWWQAA